MQFTIDRKRLIKMIEIVRRSSPGTRTRPSARVMRIYACASRVFVEANGMTAGEETMVLRDGGCTQPIKRFLALLKSYSNKENVTIEADEWALKMFSSIVSVTGYTADVKPPADFIVGRVTDTWVSGATRS
jgi:DNA polymerase III sliding clamp (beta) subunit (PCNA family)